MQIRNDFHSFSGREYQDSHTHHITKCLHEEGHKQHMAASGMKQNAADSSSASQTAQRTQQDREPWPDITARKQTHRTQKGFGTLRSIWDSMGDEKGEEMRGTFSTEKRIYFHSYMEEALMGLRMSVADRIVSKWERVREKIKTNIRSALRRFGQNRDTFGALSDPKGRFTGKKDTEEKYSRRQGTRRKEQELLTAAMSDTHLMDSYSKTGQYCRLNENLTYQKGSLAKEAQAVRKNR